jgi:hypothetical protein
MRPRETAARHDRGRNDGGDGADGAPSISRAYSDRAGWVGEGEDASLWVDFGDVIDADQEPRSPEQAGPDFECFGFV